MALTHLGIGVLANCSKNVLSFSAACLTPPCTTSDCLRLRFGRMKPNFQQPVTQRNATCRNATALRKNRTRFYFLAERCGTPQGASGTLRYGLFYVTSFVNGKILALRCVTGCWKLGLTGIMCFTNYCIVGYVSYSVSVCLSVTRLPLILPSDDIISLCNTQTRSSATAEKQRVSCPHGGG